MNYLNLAIETEKLKLIPVSDKHVDDIVTYFTNEVTEYMYPSGSKSQDEIRHWVFVKNIEMKQNAEMIMAVILKENNEFLDIAAIHQVNTKTPELGIWIKKSAQGKKYGRESITALKIWAENNLEYLYLKYPVDKKISQAEKLRTHSMGKLKPNIKKRARMERYLMK